MDGRRERRQRGVAAAQYPILERNKRIIAVLICFPYQVHDLGGSLGDSATGHFDPVKALPK